MPRSSASWTAARTTDALLNVFGLIIAELWSVWLVPIGMALPASRVGGRRAGSGKA